MRIEVFCRVIDNYGDAGFAWRLCQILQTEHEAEITLWIDDRQRLSTLAPEVDASALSQQAGGILICAWPESQTSLETATHIPAELVLELFGCGLPAVSLSRFEAQAKPPLWLHVDYLTAEAWADDFNALPSPAANSRLNRYFLVPGFSTASAGLLREQKPIFQLDPQAEQAFWQHLRLPAEAWHAQPRISLFCYPQAPVASLLRCLAQREESGVLLVAGQTQIPTDISTHWRIIHLPWLSQPDYDQLLALCDINFVRGEESCVRAQLSQRPFIWQAYPQAQPDRALKITALLNKMHHHAAAQGASALSVPLQRAFALWNELDSDFLEVKTTERDQSQQLVETFNSLLDELPTWSAWSRQWSEYLRTLPRLTDSILNLYARFSHPVS